MGRHPVKCLDNVWRQARLRAAEYNDRFGSMESAAAIAGMDVSTLYAAETGADKYMPVDKAVILADLYNTPELLNHYCLHDCPIGRNHAISSEASSIDRITVKLLGHLQEEKLKKAKQGLLEIASDGRVTEDELEKLMEVLSYFEGLSKIISELKTLKVRDFGGDE